MNFKKILGLCTIAACLGCVTLLKGTEQLVTINSNVDGATITLDGMVIGVTPFAANIPKDKNTLTIQKEGYEPYLMAFSKEIDPMFFGNIITGGTLGSITDFATGAAYTYSPANYYIEMRKVDETTAAFMKRFELRQYALLHMSDISIDLGNGQGDYLETIIELAGFPKNSESVELIREVYKNSHAHEIRFSQEMVKLSNAE